MLPCHIVFEKLLTFLSSHKVEHRHLVNIRMYLCFVVRLCL